MQQCRVEASLLAIRTNKQYNGIAGIPDHSKLAPTDSLCSFSWSVLLKCCPSKSYNRATRNWYRTNFCPYLILLFLTGCSKTELPQLLISAEQISAATDALFYDGRIAVDIDGDGFCDSVIHYAYSKFGPVGTCEGLDACTPESKPVITFYIDFPEGRSQVNFLCDAIGLYSEKTKQHRDLFCGPKTRLYWNGSEYREKVAAD